MMRRREIVRCLFDAAPRALFISGLGSPSWDLASAGDSDRNFYLWGGMGQAVMVGLGLAIAQPDRRVLVVTGDGEMLMGLGSLISVAGCQPANLGILVLDNETYGETGGQASATRTRADLAAMAKGAGIHDSGLISSPPALSAMVHAPGPVFRVAKVERESAPLVLPPRDGGYLKDRMRGYLGV